MSKLLKLQFEKVLVLKDEILSLVRNFCQLFKSNFLQSWTKYLEQSKEIQKTGQDFKNIISIFACFLTAIGNV